MPARLGAAMDEAGDDRSPGRAEQPLEELPRLPVRPQDGFSPRGVAELTWAVRRHRGDPLVEPVEEEPDVGGVDRAGAGTNLDVERRRAGEPECLGHGRNGPNQKPAALREAQRPESD